MLGLGAPAQRIDIGVGDDLVHLRDQPALGHRGPAHHIGRQRRIHRREHLRVVDQIDAIHQGLKHPIINVTGFEDLAHLGQPFAQRPGVAQPAGRQPLADPQRRGHLGGHRLHGVDRPVFGLRTPR